MRATPSVTLRVTNSIAAQRRLVIEQDAARSVHVETLAIVYRRPVRKELRDAIRAARMEWRRFVLSFTLDQTEHFAGRRLIEASLRIVLPDRLEDVQRADTGYMRRENRLLPGCRDKALCAEVIHLRRLADLERAPNRTDIAEIAVDVLHLVRDAKLAQSPQRIGTAPGQEAADAIAFAEQQLCEVCSVLPADSGNECRFSHVVQASPPRIVACCARTR